jgi:hypothetical protein
MGNSSIKIHQNHPEIPQENCHQFRYAINFLDKPMTCIPEKVLHPIKYPFISREKVPILYHSIKKKSPEMVG